MFFSSLKEIILELLKIFFIASLVYLFLYFYKHKKNLIYFFLNTRLLCCHILSIKKRSNQKYCNAYFFVIQFYKLEYFFPPSFHLSLCERPVLGSSFKRVVVQQNRKLNLTTFFLFFSPNFFPLCVLRGEPQKLFASPFVYYRTVVTHQQGEYSTLLSLSLSLFPFVLACDIISFL